MIELDVKDRKILYHLSKDGRTAHTKLAKIVELSQNSIKYRIDRLKEQGVIKKFTAVTNIGALKLDTFTVILKFNEDIYEHPEIIDFFKNHPFADWVATLSGQWDIFAEFVMKDLGHLQELVNGIKNHFGSKLNSYKIYFSQDTLRVEHLVADFYEGIDTEILPVKARTKQKYSIDEVDSQLLSVVNQDSSLSYLDISRRTGLSFDVVRYRLKSLVEKGIIIKFFPEVSLPKLGYTSYLNILNLKNVSMERMETLRKKLMHHPHITYAFVDTIEYNIVFTCAFLSPDGIDHLSRSLRKEYGDIINKQEYLLIKDEIVFNLFPKGINVQAMQ